MANVLPWSYSSLNAFETCPRRFYLTRITKEVIEKQTTATLHGNEVHKALELATLGTKALPEKYAAYKPIVDKVRAATGKKLVEYKFALTRGFKPTTFFAKDAWVRGVIDLAVVGPETAVVLDHKTGKVKTDGDQLKLFAGVTFAAFPHVQRVKTGYLWLAHNAVTHAEFRKEDTSTIWQDFLPRVARMEQALKDDRWVPKPSGLCKSWCPVGKKNCEFCGS